ncbi:hypothetical protein ACHAQA_008704 [Verticillium albo-atrum]
MHSPILDMPLEILELIFIDFEPHHLRDASLVSRVFNAAATPALYRTMSLEANWGPLPQIPRLLQTMMNRPDICELVKTVVIGKAGHKRTKFPAKNTPYFPVPLSPVNVSQAVELISQIGMGHQDCWIEHFKKGDTEAFLTLLLTLLPNLTSLTIKSPYFHSAPFLSLAIQEAFRPAKARDQAHTMFQNLEIVSFDHNNMWGQGRWPEFSDHTALSVYRACSPAGPDFSNLAALSLFYLPSLREISVPIYSDEDHGRQEFWPCGVPDVGGLEVMKVNGIRENRLGDVLATCVRLRKLTWTISYYSRAVERYSNRPIDRDQVVAALAVPSRTLTDLTLISFIQEEQGWYNYKPDPTIGPAGSLRALRDFASIKNLTVSWFMLMGQDGTSPWALADVLPRNLEHLVIDDQRIYNTPVGFKMDEFTVYGAIRDWLRNWHDVTPRLKSFRITLWGILPGTWTARIRLELKKLCERVGVEHHQDEDLDSDDEDEDWKIPTGWEW